MKWLLPIVALTLALETLLDSAQAQRDCLNPMTQLDMNQCAIQDHDKADDALNASYKVVSGKVHGDELELLKQAQRARITFRDAECEFMRQGALGGTVNRIVVARCMAALTKERLQQMVFYRSCEEGDTSCPTWNNP